MFEHSVLSTHFTIRNQIAKGSASAEVDFQRCFFGSQIYTFWKIPMYLIILPSMFSHVQGHQNTGSKESH